MQAIGMIETKGLVAAIQSADVMLKAAQVQLLSKTLVKGGIVTITISGDVGAVKSAVDAGAVAVLQMGGCLLSQHVIARPSESISGLVMPDEGACEDSQNMAEALLEVECTEVTEEISQPLLASPVIQAETEEESLRESPAKVASAERIPRPPRSRLKKR